MSNKFERKAPKVSIVIPSWFTDTQNGKYGEHETYWFAVECLARLQRMTKREDYELIIIDNGSRLPGSGGPKGVRSVNDAYADGTFPVKYDIYWPNIYFDNADILIRNTENLGFGPACNQGFAVARGEYIVCLNNDILVWEGWLDAMLSIYDKELDPKVGVVMPALIPNLRDAHEAITLENPEFELNKGKYGAGAEFGSLWMAKRKLLQQIADTRDGYQVFDENFKLGMGEDRWLWQQVRHLGFETYRTHDTRVFHQGNMTIGKVKDRKSYTGPNREYLQELKDKHE